MVVVGVAVVVVVVGAVVVVVVVGAAVVVNPPVGFVEDERKQKNGLYW